MKRLFAILALLAAACAAQGIAFTSTATTTQNLTGQGAVVVPIPGAQIYVCSGVYAGTACNAGTAVTVYQDPALTVPYANPLGADTQGNFSFWAAAGNYFYTVSGAGAVTASYQLTLPSSGSNADDIHFNQSFSGGINNTYYANPFYQFMQSSHTPAVPTVTVTGGTGFSWRYAIVELSGPEAVSLESSAAFASAASTLNASNYVTINAVCQSNNDSIAFYRTQSGGTPSTTGQIGVVACASNSTASLNDTGQNINGFAVTPVINTTGDVAANTIYVGRSPITGADGRPHLNLPGNIIFPNSYSSGGSIFTDNQTSGSTANRNGINFNGNTINISEMNHDGSVIPGSTVATFAFPQVVLFPFGLGLGVGASSTSSKSSIWPDTYTQTNGTTITGALVSSGPIGGAFPNSTWGVVAGKFYAPTIAQKGTIGFGTSGSTIFTCLAGLGECDAAGLYEVSVYATDGTACANRGSASLQFQVGYTDTRGAIVGLIPLSTDTGAITTNPVQWATGTSFAQGRFTLWSTGVTSITLQENSVQCTTGAASASYFAEIRRLN